MNWKKWMSTVIQETRNQSKWTLQSKTALGCLPVNDPSQEAENPDLES